MSLRLGGGRLARIGMIGPFHVKQFSLDCVGFLEYAVCRVIAIVWTWFHVKPRGKVTGRIGMTVASGSWRLFGVGPV